jgi:hypothetical protein
MPVDMIEVSPLNHLKGGNMVPPSQPYGPPPGAPPTQQKTNGLAVASLILGILWVWWVGSVLAVIFGHVALAQIKRTGAAGRGLAVAGLALGYVGIASALLVGVIVLAAGNGNNPY